MSPLPGAVFIGNIANLQNTVRQNDIDEIWVIVRSYKNPISAFDGVPVIHVPELSPSPGLFKSYLNWRNRGEWGINMFLCTYVPWFLRDMLEEDARQRLSLIVKQVNQGKRILLACYCWDEFMCHRSIIKGLLQGRGVPCGTTEESPINYDYSKYFRIYLKMWNELLNA